MSTDGRSSSASVTSGSDPRCIVPIHPPEGAEIQAAAAAAGIQPHLDYRNGPLLANVDVFTLFWGSDWQGAPLSQLATRLNQFFASILQSDLIDQLSEYSVPAFPIGHGTLAGTVTVTDDPPQIVTDGDVQQFVQDQIDGGTAPPPTANRLYFVYLPPGITSQSFGEESCVNYCGYHSHVDGQLFYAVMPFPTCSGCRRGGALDEFAALTMTSSHELVEAITDPIPGQGWYWRADQEHQGEIGDICNARPKQVGVFTVQEEWSNQASGCV